jgi:methyl-accepting chemotaxis protein
VRWYTTTNVNPLLAPDLATQESFISEAVPAFSAREVFEHFRVNEDYETFFYKEAAPNPTNPRDQADSFERDLVQRFRTDGELKELTGFRDRGDERLYYIARPLAVTSETCLACHGDPAQASASLIDSYGADGGFGWQLNEIVAAQIIYVPASKVFNEARLWLAVVLGIFVGVFIIVIVGIRALMKPNVIRPIEQLARLAQKISADTATVEDLERDRLSDVAARGDELGELAQVFQQMAAQVYAREQRLKREVEALRIQIDHDKRVTQVAEITETEYFQDLQRKAGQLRRRMAGSTP